MIEINLPLHRKARIWIEEVQQICFDSTHTLKKTYENVGESFPAVRKGNFIVELKIPVGGRTIYGLLGAEFKNSALKVFSIEIQSSDSTRKVLDNSIYKGLDDIYVGLPTAYLKSIKKGVLHYFENEDIAKPDGNLVFKFAAYSEVGSNEIVFENLSYIISSHFFSNNEFEKESDYINLFSIIQ